MVAEEGKTYTERIHTMSDPYLNVETTGNPYNPDVPQWYDTIHGEFNREGPVNGTDISHSMGGVRIKFKVFDGLTTKIKAKLTVDDWGFLTIHKEDAPNDVPLSISRLQETDDSADPRGGHAEWSGEAEAELGAGNYVITVFQQNATYIKGDPKFNISKCVFDITAERPTNLWTRQDANNLLEKYANVDYEKYPSVDADGIWELLGALKDMSGRNTCATRVSIALNQAGIRLDEAKNSDGKQAADNVSKRGWDNTCLAGGNYVITSVENTWLFLRNDLLKCNPHFTEYNYKPEAGDVVIFARFRSGEDYAHTGICLGTAQDKADGLTRDVWVLYRANWKPKQ